MLTPATDASAFATLGSALDLPGLVAPPPEQPKRDGRVHVAVISLIAISITLTTLFTLGGNMLTIFGDVTDSWATLQERSEEKADTKIAGPTGLSVSATSTVQITVTNEGDVALGRFSDWDVIFEIQRAPGLGIAYLTYTQSASPGTNQWTAQSISVDSSPPIPEYMEPGVLNPGEKMTVLANPSPSVTQNTYDRAVFVTPNGVSAEVIFKVVP